MHIYLNKAVCIIAIKQNQNSYQHSRTSSFEIEAYESHLNRKLGCNIRKCAQEALAKQ